MHRFGFYILASLLTFGIGSIIVFEFYRDFKENSVVNSQTIFLTKRYKTTNLLKSSENSNKEQEAPKKLFCEDDQILKVWNDLINDETFQDWETLSGESLNCVDILELKEIDLNRDNQKEILVRGKNFNLCSPVGNCAFWIFEKKEKIYRKILSSTDYKDITEMPDQISKAKTKGYFDVVLKGHFSASDTTYTFYKFNGKKYQQNKCLVQTYISGTTDNPKWEFLSCKKFYSRLKNN